MHHADIVARAVEQIVRLGLFGGEIWRDQRIVVGIEPPQQVVVGPVGDLNGFIASSEHGENSPYPVRA
jgi:hypothetical protein